MSATLIRVFYYGSDIVVVIVACCCSLFEQIRGCLTGTLLLVVGTLLVVGPPTLGSRIAKHEKGSARWKRGARGVRGGARGGGGSSIATRETDSK